MNTILKPRLPAILCVLTLLVCSIATYPVAEIGINDDWSYVKSAEVLARTGQVVYNGWATAMLGWQIYLGALFAVIFGPSFTAIRASTLLIAMATVYLTHRTLIRAGVNSRNATIGTLLLGLSPVFMPLALTFMSDIGGLFVIVLCAYSCLRALRAQTERSVLAWLAFAALSNALGGTVRQIAWLGALVMFPCAVWLLRSRPKVIFAGVLLYLVSGIFIYGSLHWFLQQPYSVPEPLVPGSFAGANVLHMLGRFFRAFFSLAMFLLPILVAFIPAVSFRNRFNYALIAGGGLVCAIAGLLLHHHHKLESCLAPFSVPGSYVSPRGLIDIMVIKGDRPVILNIEIRVVLTAVILLALICLFTFLFTSRSRQISIAGAETAISWPDLLVLFVPFTFAYLAIIVPRAAFVTIYDRYLPPLIFVGILLLLRLYQDKVGPKLSIVSNVLVLIFAAFAIAGTHDAFSLYRARLSAINELRAAGVPDTSIDGGFDFNGMTQIEDVGYVNDPRIRVPATFRTILSPQFPKDCAPEWSWLTPVVVPGYALSLDPAACGGLSHFPPVQFRDWLGDHSINIYIVNTVKPGSDQR